MKFHQCWNCSTTIRVFISRSSVLLHAIFSWLFLPRTVQLLTGTSCFSHNWMRVGSGSRSNLRLLGLTYLDHFSHVALRAGVLGGVLDFDQDDEEQVVPHVVLHLDVLLEGDCLVVELVSLQTCRVQSNMHAITCMEREREREKNKLRQTGPSEKFRNSPRNIIK